MKYSIIIPTYNHCNDLLKPCIDSIFKYSNVYDIEFIISANGCKDNTNVYLETLNQKYKLLELENNLKIVWHDESLGYAKAVNVGIEQATTDLIVLLNNDTILLPQHKNQWLELLANPFKQNKNCGISCVIKGPSEPAGHDFAIFFCVMIHRKVFDKIGLLSLDYGVGGGEDTEFSIECEKAGFDVVIVKSWLNILDNNISTPGHIHDTSHYSFVFYLNVPDNADQLCFYIKKNPNEPFSGSFFDHKNKFNVKTLINEYTVLNSLEYSFQPKEGSVFIFPSNLDHCTKK